MKLKASKGYKLSIPFMFVQDFVLFGFKVPLARFLEKDTHTSITACVHTGNHIHQLCVQGFCDSFVKHMYS